jgi:hypothetical protein
MYEDEHIRFFEGMAVAIGLGSIAWTVLIVIVYWMLILFS